MEINKSVEAITYKLTGEVEFMESKLLEEVTLYVDIFLESPRK